MSIKSSALKVKATVQFPHFEQEDVYNGRNVGYGFILGHLSDAAVEAIEEAFGETDFNGNRRVKNKESMDFGNHLKIKSKYPIISVDTDGNSFEGRTNSIGYGSRVEVVLKADKSGQPRAVKVVITELEEFEGGEDVAGPAL